MGVIDALRGTRLGVGGAPAPEARSVACLNCGTALAGPFCSECGQRDIPPYPSVRELVVDAFWELSGWDGRFASTVRALVRRPGMLTREFLEGRRARYLSPLRLYLMASLAYFVVASAAPSTKSGRISHKPTPTKPSPTTSGSAPTTAPERVGAAISQSVGNADPDPDVNLGNLKEELTPEQKASALKDLERAPAVLRPLARRLVTDPAGFKRGMFETMPRMLFVLLPVFAGIVALFYRGRKYPEHLYFAIHLHAFVFLALTMTSIVKFTRSPVLVGIAGTVALFWVPIYATLSFRRAYGGGLGRTLAKEAGIGTIYVFASAIAFMLTIYWVAFYA